MVENQGGKGNQIILRLLIAHDDGSTEQNQRAMKNILLMTVWFTVT